METSAGAGNDRGSDTIAAPACSAPLLQDMASLPSLNITRNVHGPEIVSQSPVLLAPEVQDTDNECPPILVVSGSSSPAVLRTPDRPVDCTDLIDLTAGSSSSDGAPAGGFHVRAGLSPPIHPPPPELVSSQGNKRKEPPNPTHGQQSGSYSQFMSNDAAFKRRALGQRGAGIDVTRSRWAAHAPRADVQGQLAGFDRPWVPHPLATAHVVPRHPLRPPDDDVVIVLDGSPEPVERLAGKPARSMYHGRRAPSEIAHMRRPQTYNFAMERLNSMMMAVESPGSSADVVDLTDINAAEEARLRKRARSDTMGREMVCYGMLQTIVQPLNYEAYKNSGTEKTLKVVIAPDMDHVPPVGLKCIPFRVSTEAGVRLGKLKEEVAIAISSFWPELQVEGSIPRCQYNKFTAPLNLYISGPIQAAIPVGNVFSKYQLSFQPVNRPLAGMRYYNPQRELLGSTRAASNTGPQPALPSYSSAWCKPERAATPSGEDVQTQIDAVYNAITSAEDLGEADPDKDLVTPLYKHQRQALHFMMERERPVDFNNSAERARSLWKVEKGVFTSVITTEVVTTAPTQALGGILADDMGLGKTIEVISLILKNRSRTPVRPLPRTAPPPQPPNPYPFLPSRQPQPLQLPPDSGKSLESLIPSAATLIVCPLSTVSNWEEQIATHVAFNKLSVYVYHGPNRCQDASALAKNDIVISTYNVLALEYGREQKAQSQNQVAPHRSPLQLVYWLRIVLDEAHVIKERNTHQAKAAFNLSGERRWCLTGTPIHNKIDDLYSLFRFLGLEPFSQWKSFAYYIMKPLKSATAGTGGVAVSRLQTVMKLVTLRRTKHQQIDGKPIITLPPKHQHVYSLTLDPEEQQVYDQVFEKASTIFNDLDKTGKVFRYYAALLEMLLRLRQVVSHVGLIADWKGFGESAIVWQLDQCAVPLMRKTINNNACDVMCPMCQVPLAKAGLKEIKDLEAAEGLDEATVASLQHIRSPQNPILAAHPGAMGSSTKVRTLIEDLKTVRRNQEEMEPGAPPIKSVVFSQWTQMLDFCGPALAAANIKYCRLDGKMSRNDRTISLEKFKFDPSVTVILVSLKAGGVGLNLTVASRVYILEPYWNPAVEDQAQDRVHRMGQTREVNIVRFVVENSVEVIIEQIKKKKRDLVSTAFREEAAQPDAALRTSSSTSSGNTSRRTVAREKEDLQAKRLDDLRSLFGFAKT
ncbi:hypothetical protein HKX48_005713 [Thoreauomyces humboldtii]|nr:hypothetical protein HKX48_005713 [Thoreauomyces humboldtii]